MLMKIIYNIAFSAFNRLLLMSVVPTNICISYAYKSLAEMTFDDSCIYVCSIYRFEFSKWCFHILIILELMIRTNMVMRTCADDNFYPTNCAHISEYGKRIFYWSICAEYFFTILQLAKYSNVNQFNILSQFDLLWILIHNWEEQVIFGNSKSVNFFCRKKIQLFKAIQERLSTTLRQTR